MSEIDLATVSLNEAYLCIKRQIPSLDFSNLAFDPWGFTVKLACRNSYHYTDIKRVMAAKFLVDDVEVSFNRFRLISEDQIGLEYRYPGAMT